MSKKKITFQNPQGMSLSGLLETPESPKAYALFAHCFTCGKDIKAAARIAKALVNNNIAVLRFDFTGLGSSEGDFSNSNFSSNVADLVAASEYLREMYQAPSILIGHSLGGAAVIAAAKYIPEAKGVVTIGAPAEAAHVMKQFRGHVEAIRDIGEYNVMLAGREFTIKKQFLDDIKAQKQDANIANLRRALLVFHSPIDTTVSIEQAQKIYLAAKHPKSFISLDSADHLLTNSQDADYVASCITAWSSRYL
ncbi:MULTISPECIES: alpha/beta hydrolase family protein [Pseudomonas]|uniref:alpha/beta hydrolase family protein n=1 Tax=Pseudomonas TaxID=286 RepID=UPI001F25E2BE|nr:MULTISPECIES: alpha/beta hydrolase [Pseudomonas]WLH21092.1 alpha/beta hydrolase [Pseudomonas simiae]WLI32006.1 alpha/beta hydrolase [Pseudomonas rhodesiae]